LTNISGFFPPNFFFSLFLHCLLFTYFAKSGLLSLYIWFALSRPANLFLFAYAIFAIKWKAKESSATSPNISKLCAIIMNMVLMLRSSDIIYFWPLISNICTFNVYLNISHFFKTNEKAAYYLKDTNWIC